MCTCTCCEMVNAEPQASPKRVYLPGAIGCALNAHVAQTTIICTQELHSN